MIRLTRHIKSNSVTPNLVNDEDKIEVTSLPEHPFHLVDPSPWPAFSSLGALTTTMGAVMYFHGYVGGGAMLSTGLLTIIYAMFVWWRDVVTESTYRCLHTAKVQEGLRWGMLLFIVSEIMFFFAFFWAFFHSSISPGVEIGGVWPPKGIEVLSPWEVPLLNVLRPASLAGGRGWSIVQRAMNLINCTTDLLIIGFTLCMPLLARSKGIL